MSDASEFAAENRAQRLKEENSKLIISIKNHKPGTMLSLQGRLRHSEYFDAIFRSIPTNVVNLDLSNNDLDSIDRNVVLKRFKALKKINLSNTSQSRKSDTDLVALINSLPEKIEIIVEEPVQSRINKLLHDARIHSAKLIERKTGIGSITNLIMSHVTGLDEELVSETNEPVPAAKEPAKKVEPQSPSFAKQVTDVFACLFSRPNANKKPDPLQPIAKLKLR